MKCPKCQYIGFDGHTRCRNCGYDLSLAATTEMAPGDGAASDGVAEAATDVVYRPESSARAQARAAIQKRAASRTPSPESFDLPLFATPGVDDRPALPASRPPLSVRRAADGPRGRAAAAAAFAPAQATPPAEPMALGFADATAPAAANTPTVGDETGGRDDARLEFDTLSLAPAPEPDLDLSFTVGGTPLGGDVRAGGGALILPGREVSGSASAGFARVRPVDSIDLGAGNSRARGGLRVGQPADRHRRRSCRRPCRTAIPAPPPIRTSAPRRRMPRPTAGRRRSAPACSPAWSIWRCWRRWTPRSCWRRCARPASTSPTSSGCRWRRSPSSWSCSRSATCRCRPCSPGVPSARPRSAWRSSKPVAVPVRLGPAVVRALIQVLTVPAAGIGFLPALLGADRRSLYDRLAGTDVVRASRTDRGSPHPMTLPADGSPRPGGAAMRRPLTLPVLVATVAGIGFVPFAPGTFGSIPGVAIAIGLRALAAPWWAEGAVLVALFAAGVWAASAAETYFGRIDPGPIVIDEVVGMLITTLFLPLSWTGWLVAFVVFRACDVVKPFPAGRAERLPGGFGVMCDDVLAGVWGYAIMRGLLWAFPGWL